MVDAKDCRENATHCIEMANDALNTDLQSVLFEMANMWLKLAAAVERCSAVLSTYRDLDVERESLCDRLMTSRPTATLLFNALRSADKQ